MSGHALEQGIDPGLDGYLTLTFPIWLIRADPRYVAAKILQALTEAGYRP
jgi:hypothetical protein